MGRRAPGIVGSFAAETKTACCGAVYVQGSWAGFACVGSGTVSVREKWDIVKARYTRASRAGNSRKIELGKNLIN